MYLNFIEKAEKSLEDKKNQYYINNRDTKDVYDLIIRVAAEYPEGLKELKEYVKDIEEAKEKYKNTTGKRI